MLEQAKGLNAYKLKWIAIITMLIDHFYKVFAVFLIPAAGSLFHVGETSSYLILIAMCGIGCATMPIFAFFIAEGCRFTRHKRHYIARLLLFAIIAEVPFQIMGNSMSGVPISLKFGITNILFTFGLGAIACCAFQFLNDKNHHIIKWSIPLLCAASAYLLHTDYGAFGVLFVFISYLIRDKTAKLLSLFGLIFLFRGLIYPILDFAVYGFDVDILISYAILLVYTWLSIPLLAAYSGKRGKKSKYFFYIFYPLHMLILGLAFMFIV